MGRWFGYCAGTRYKRASEMSVRTTKSPVFCKAVTLLYVVAYAQVREERKGGDRAVPTSGGVLNLGHSISWPPMQEDAFQVGDCFSNPRFFQLGHRPNIINNCSDNCARRSDRELTWRAQTQSRLIRQH